MDLEKFGIDSCKSEGVWVDIDETTSLKIGMAGGLTHKKISRELLKNNRRALRSLRQGDRIEELEKIETMSLAKAVLLGWKGLKIKGEEIPYSTEKAFEILSDPKYVVFRTMVEEISADNSNFEVEYEEDAEGN